MFPTVAETLGEVCSCGRELRWRQFGLKPRKPYLLHVLWSVRILFKQTSYRYKMLLLAKTGRWQYRNETVKWQRLHHYKAVTGPWCDLIVTRPWIDRYMTPALLWLYRPQTVSRPWCDRVQTLTILERKLLTTPLANYMQQIPSNDLPFLSWSTKIFAFRKTLAIWFLLTNRYFTDPQWNHSYPWPSQ